MKLRDQTMKQTISQSDIGDTRECETILRGEYMEIDEIIKLCKSEYIVD